MDGETLTTDIVIVGLGPVGAVAANLAARAGFRVMVLDRESHPYAKPRAIVFDAEIMRVFAAIGLAEAAAAITRPLGGSVYLGADHKPIRTFRSPGPAHDRAWHPSNLFYQPQLEGLLRSGLARFPDVDTRLGYDVNEVSQGRGRATVGAVGADGDMLHVDAKFVLACDGASSMVRKRLGVGLDDIGFEERWLVVDTFVRGPMRWPGTHEIPAEVRDGSHSLMVCDPARPSTLIPGVGAHRRWEYMLMPGECQGDVVPAEWLNQLLAEWVDLGDVEIVRSAVYRFRALVASRWRTDRVFLLGDAAHQTPPFFGQGMCHGIRDAAQLIWKLRLVEDGVAAPAMLDTYQREREPHVREIIAASVKAGAAVCITDVDRARARDAEFRALEAARGTARVAMTDVVPPIRAGLIDGEGGGMRLPEFAVAEAGAVRRVDDMLAGRFTLLSCGGLDAHGAGWEAIGGQAICIAGDLLDLDGRLGRWLSSIGAMGVIVRPDRHVFGVARNSSDLTRLMGELLGQLGATAPAGLPLRELAR